MFADAQDYGSATAATSSLTLSGANVSTTAQTVTLSTGVSAVVVVAASGGKNNTYLSKAIHTAGDNMYGADSDASGIYRKPCVTAGGCTAAADLALAPTTAAVNTPPNTDFAAPWIPM